MQITKMLKGRLAAVVAGAAVVGLVGAGAGYSIDTITSKDIKDGSIKLKDLRAGTVKKLQGQTGPAGAAGAAGPAGPIGPQGPAGNAQAPVTSLTGNFVVTKDDCGAGSGADTGNVAIVGNAIKFDSLDDGNARARVDYAPLVGKTLNDLAGFEYSAEYTQTGPDVHQGLPYFIVKLTDGPDADTDVDSVIFTPGTQAAPVQPLQSGMWQHFSVTEGTGRFNDDPGAAPDEPWQDIVRAHGTQTIVRAGIQAGCGGSGTQDTVALVDNVAVDIDGQRSAFNFGS